MVSPAAATVVAELSDRIDAITQTIQKQEAPTTGITQDKETVRDTLEDKIREIGSLVAAYAASVGNMTLFTEVDVTPSDLDKMSDESIGDVANRVS
jgi:hypothetical protein